VEIMAVLNRDRLKKQLMRHEGVRVKPYQDSEGILTIGVGRNLEDKGLSESEVMFLLNNDIEEAYMECQRIIPGFRVMNSVRRQVLVNMAFNLGIPRLMGFKKMMAALRIGNYEEAAVEMLDSKWARQVGDRALELAEMMRKGVQLD
jgi:lysozyme